MGQHIIMCCAHMGQHIIMCCAHWSIHNNVLCACVNIIIIIIKKDRQWKAGRGRLTPYQSEDPSPTLPTNRGNEEKGKIVEDKKGESN